MSFTIGNKFKITLFGASHDNFIGVSIEGIPGGFEINTDNIVKELQRRRPNSKFSTKRIEKDDFQISGLLNNKTCGGPITFIIPNCDIKSEDYNRNIFRPSHSDYPAYVKYNGFNDYRGGGFFSGRMTAPLVVAGSVAMDILREKNIEIYSHILSIKNIKEMSFEDLMKKSDYNNILNDLKEKSFPCIEKESEYLNLLEEYKNDSLGGICEIMVLGMPVGVGEPYFDSIESVLSRLYFSVPGIKGVEFGDGFGISELLGSEANDELTYKNREISLKSNHSGGINGGLSNGMPIISKVSIRPTPSILTEQDTVDISKKENTKISVKGRHDNSIVLRIAPVMEAVTAIGILNLLKN